MKGNVDVVGKSREWHTAFFYLAEHVKILSDGAINHKDLYSLVGVDGRYVNHENPLVRKRTAGALSRIVHSKRYVQDMQTRYTQNTLAFERASRIVCANVLAQGGLDESGLCEYLKETCWEDVRRGLCNERESWRPDLDMFRIDREIRVLFQGLDADAFDEKPVETVANEQVDHGETPWAQTMLAALLHIIAFGHLEYQHARSLMDKQPTGALPLEALKKARLSQACLVKFTDAEHSGILGSWLLATTRPFTIGRYTDCDVVEANNSISRVHGCIYHKSNMWHFEDMGSRNGSLVKRVDGSIVLDSKRDGPHASIVLESGDEIVLSGISRYWFGYASGQMAYTVVRYLPN